MDEATEIAGPSVTVPRTWIVNPKENLNKPSKESIANNRLFIQESVWHRSQIPDGGHDLKLRFFDKTSTSKH